MKVRVLQILILIVMIALLTAITFIITYNLKGAEDLFVYNSKFYGELDERIHHIIINSEEFIRLTEEYLTGIENESIIPVKAALKPVIYEQINYFYANCSDIILNVDEINSTFNKLFSTSDKLVLMKTNGELDDINDVIEESKFFDEKIHKIDSVLEVSHDQVIAARTQARQDIQDKIFSSSMIIYISFLVYLISFILVDVIIHLLIIKPIINITDVVKKISKGNLRIKFEEKSKFFEISELKDALNRIMTSMKRSIVRVKGKNEKEEEK